MAPRPIFVHLLAFVVPDLAFQLERVLLQRLYHLIALLFRPEPLLLLVGEEFRQGLHKRELLCLKSQKTRDIARYIFHIVLEIPLSA